MKFLQTIRSDIEAVFNNDPAARSVFEVIFTYSGLHALWAHRIAHWFYRKKFKNDRTHHFSDQPFLYRNRDPSRSEDWKHVFIDHGMGVVIGETCEIGDDVVLYQGVTLGGTGKEKGKRHPTIGNMSSSVRVRKCSVRSRSGDYARSAPMPSCCAKCLHTARWWAFPESRQAEWRSGQQAGPWQSSGPCDRDVRDAKGNRPAESRAGRVAAQTNA